MSADHDLAAALALGAGEVLMRLRTSGSATGEMGDAASQRYLLDQLTTHRPLDAVLSEESVDDARRLDAERVWIIDPLDGSREFGDINRSDFAVHIALWTRRGGLVLGAVGLPARGTVVRSDESVSPPVPHDGPLRLAVSRSRPPRSVQDLAIRAGAELIPMGSAGVKAMAVVAGEVDAYVHAGGQYEWDSAAPAAVAAAAGLHTSRVDGSPLRYNQPSPWLPDLVICRPALAEVLLQQLRHIHEETS